MLIAFNTACSAVLFTKTELDDEHWDLKVSGKSVYSKLKFESGVHRVQRVPATESSGRVHTSTATVAVMPEVDDVEVHIDPKVSPLCS